MSDTIQAWIGDEQDRATIKQAAELDSMSVSRWAGAILLQAARRRLVSARLAALGTGELVAQDVDR